MDNKNTYPHTGKQLQSVSTISHSHSQGILIYKEYKYIYMYIYGAKT